MIWGHDPLELAVPASLPADSDAPALLCSVLHWPGGADLKPDPHHAVGTQELLGAGGRRRRGVGAEGVCGGRDPIAGPGHTQGLMRTSGTSGGELQPP